MREVNYDQNMHNTFLFLLFLSNFQTLLLVKALLID